MEKDIMLIPTNKSFTDFANDIIMKVDEGTVDVFKLAKQIKFYEKAFELIKEQTKDKLIKYAERLADKDIAEVAFTTKYDYKVCGDFEWEWYENQIANLRELQKEREAKLKLVKLSETIEFTNPSTGEIALNEVKEPIKKYYEFVKIK